MSAKWPVSGIVTNGEADIVAFAEHNPGPDAGIAEPRNERSVAVEIFEIEPSASTDSTRIVLLQLRDQGVASSDRKAALHRGTDHLEHQGVRKVTEHATKDMLQPMVRTHPETGRQALYVSPRFTIGIADMPDDEAQPLLDKLFAIMLEPRFRYRHKWRDGDLVIWDNRCLNHQACGGYSLPDIRRMHRTTIRGDRPFYRPAAQAIG